MNKILTVRGLCRGYQSGAERIEVLSDLDLDLEQNEMLAVTGVSGSGKTTLLHILGGMDRPDRGSVEIQGTDITRLGLPEMSRFRNQTVGFVFQSHHLLPEFTAIENVMMPVLLRGEPPSQARISAGAALASVHMSNRIHHRPGELSGGEQQRVAIARALVGRPKLLLADEPTGDLDPHTGMAIAELLLDLHRTHDLTSIIVTHNEKLAAMCARIRRLENGRL